MPPVSTGTGTGSAGNVGQEILQCADTEAALLQGPNGLRGSATA